MPPIYRLPLECRDGFSSPCGAQAFQIPLQFEGPSSPFSWSIIQPFFNFVRFPVGRQWLFFFPVTESLSPNTKRDSLFFLHRQEEKSTVPTILFFS